MRRFVVTGLTIATCSLLLAGCGTTSKPTAHRTDSGASASAGSPSAAPAKRGGGYYQDDGPGDNPPPNLDRVPDAVPRVDPYASGANRPYNVFGVEYVPDLSDKPFKQRGIASWYGRKFHGQRTSSGEIYDMYGMTAAHPTLPIPSYARVTNIANGRSVIVRVNDRGPFHPGRVIDLSFAAAYRLGYANVGSINVEVERILPRDIRNGNIPATTGVAPLPLAPPPATPSSAPLLVAAVPLGAAAGVGSGIVSGAGVVTSSAAVAGSRAAAPLTNTPPPPAPATPPSSGAATVEDPNARLAALRAELPPDLVPVESSRIVPTGANAAPSEEALAVAPLPVPAAEVPTAPATGDGFFLQLGAFHAKNGADAFIGHISGQIEPALVARLRIVTGGNLFRVQLGPYGDRLEAENAARHLHEDLDVAAMVISPRS